MSSAEEQLVSNNLMHILKMRGGFLKSPLSFSGMPNCKENLLAQLIFKMNIPFDKVLFTFKSQSSM
jgi:hypothetical protein